MHGVKNISVSLEHKRATIIYDEHKISPAVLLDAMQEVGYASSIAKLRPPSIRQEKANGVSRRTSLATRRPTSPAASTENIAVLSIDGMTCHSCVKNIEETMSGKSGIISIKVALKEKRGVIRYDPALWTPQKVADAVDDMGYEAKAIEGEDGKRCLFCYLSVSDGFWFQLKPR